MRDPYTIDRYEPGYDFDSDPRGSAVYYEDMVILIDKIKAGHSEEVTDLRDALAAATAERASYGDVMSDALGQCENERDALRAEAAEYRILVDRCRERNKELGAENERLRDLLAELTYTPGNPSQDTL
jgi:uncharacterized coiled-coil DUF342 family protein